MAKPSKKEYPEFYQPYIDALADQGNIVSQMETSLSIFEKELSELEPDQQEYRYADGKWTIKEIVQHLIDAERVFVYRALRYSRKDQSSLLSYDENMFVANYEINERKYDNLVKEFSLLRRSTILMFHNFDEEILGREGKVEENIFTVRALGYLCSGHLLHHLKVITERYLLNRLN